MGTELEKLVDKLETLSSTVMEFEDVLKEVEKKLDRVKTVTKKWKENLQGIDEIFPSILTTELDITVSEDTFDLAEMAKSTVIETLESTLKEKAKELVGKSKTAKVFLGITTVMAGVAIAFNELWEKMKAEDLQNRFGDIALSLEELETAAKEIIDNKNLLGITEILSDLDELSEMERQLQETADTLGLMNWKVSIGMELTEDEQGAYKNAIDSYISDINAYVDQQQYTANMGIGLFLNNSQTSAQVREVVNGFYDDQRATLADLGTKLNNAVTDAFNDGLLLPEEAETIAGIQESMAEIQKQLSTSETKARLQMLEMEYSGKELTPEFYKEFLNKRNEILEQYKTDLDEAFVFSLATINLSYEAKVKSGENSQADWDAAVAELITNKELEMAELELNSLLFDLNTLSYTYGEGMDAAFDGLVNDLMVSAQKFAEGKDYAFDNFTRIMDGTRLKFEKIEGAEGLSNFNELINMAYNPVELENCAQSIYDAGQEIPKALADALISTYTLNAIGGNMDAMYKLMLVVADSEHKEEVMKQMESVGISIPTFLAQGIGDTEYLATSSITNLLKNLNEIILTDEMGSNAYNLGKNITENLQNGLLWREKYDISQINFEGFKWLGMQGYSFGGLPRAGEIFVARENQMPELVGRFGSQTMVANNDQIVEGIAKAVEPAVYNAVVSAMAHRGDETIKVFIGDREITDVAIEGINERTKRNGKTPIDLAF